MTQFENEIGLWETRCDGCGHLVIRVRDGLPPGFVAGADGLHWCDRCQEPEPAWAESAPDHWTADDGGILW